VEGVPFAYYLEPGSPKSHVHGRLVAFPNITIRGSHAALDLCRLWMVSSGKEFVHDFICASERNTAVYALHIWSLLIWLNLNKHHARQMIDHPKKSLLENDTMYAEPRLFTHLFSKA
jgi:hypothetical protein